MLLCPACDHILNAAGCQACGWKTGDKWPAHRLMQGSAHPLKARDLYPPATGVTNTPVVEEPEMSSQDIVRKVFDESFGNVVPGPAAEFRLEKRESAPLPVPLLSASRPASKPKGRKVSETIQ